MTGYDWNQNGEHDCFDDFMDMEVASDLFDDEEPCRTQRSTSTQSEPFIGKVFKLLSEIGADTIAIVAICVIPFLIVLDINWELIESTIAYGILAFLFIRWLRR